MRGLGVKEEAIFRSADMSFIELYIPTEISRETLYLLGECGVIMFKDLNLHKSTFQRSYAFQIKKLNDIQHSLDYMDHIVKLHSNDTFKYLPPTITDASDTSTRLNSYNNPEHMNIPRIDDINNICEEIKLFQNRLQQLNDSYLELKSKLLKLLDERCVLYEVGKFLSYNPGLVIGGDTATDLEENQNLLSNRESANIPSDDLSTFAISDDEDEEIYNNNNNVFNNHYGSLIVGSIDRDKIEPLNRILWRVLRGNLFFHHTPINVNNNKYIKPDANSEDEAVEKDKDCFIIFTHGEILLARVRKIVESLNAKIYDFPNNNDGANNGANLNIRIEELSHILEATEQSLYTEILVIADQLPKWFQTISAEKYVYVTMNLFKNIENDSTALLGEGWIPTSLILETTNRLRDYTDLHHADSLKPVISLVETNRLPPTYHKTNKFTQAFQSIVDAYGIATYKEVNPGLATIVTFPFMFSIMFGDTGHGFILFLVGLYLILNERKFNLMKRDEIFDMAFTGRYVILLMGLFSIYIGLLYNDIFSKTMTFFSSGWSWPTDFKIGQTLEATKIPGKVYPFGLDYSWHGTENGLLFTNSYKMKLSILMGFVHMTYSFMFSLVNYRYRQSRVDIIGNFIPGLIFMQSIFGYLSWAIVYKWSKDWIKDGREAPGLLNMLINMFLSPGNIDVKLYTGQSVIQIILLLAAVICVPWLLLYKPLVLRRNHLTATRNKGYLRGVEFELSNNSDTNAGYHDDFDAFDFEVDTNDNHNGDQQVQHQMERSLLEEREENRPQVEEEQDQAKQEFNFGDIMIHQVIHTIEFCLNCISHTASYLRLWALSLAHAQLSTVLWDMTIQNSFSSHSPGSFLSVFKVVALFAMWFVLTVCVLVLMEGTSAMLHALRLHWVEAMSKFFEGEGYAYEPFSFKNLEQEGNTVE
ncbi:related to V-type proton ATPase subunit a, Golgi isoform [Saccharomycodes ludwigii]|uniref:V-type proton ATPase subunit a n=1 Tax=Saccharomycodes ludwigii TaxID=36035 RepID=A0A376B1C4_9ASCO|nr:hypothetical protein SCDLUD_003930 [Saccharomycodes ludwigii]KAH3899649.1 hypothetical protein SCDLUD_003930 [Saccharomycodes ludwigii]SSD58488.1 related to V-type proton ATPase subunit a, Golgi isoform [Saccharomycodes ludwigii]